MGSLPPTDENEVIDGSMRGSAGKRIGLKGEVRRTVGLEGPGELCLVYVVYSGMRL